MDEGIIAKLVKVIAFHTSIESESELAKRLLSVMAPYMLTWISGNPVTGWKKKHVENFKYLFEIGNYNGNEVMAMTLLSKANSAGYLETATLFKQIVDDQKSAKEDKEAHVNYKRETAFHRAAKDGDTDKVKKLLDNPEFDGNDADEIGMTPLHHAAKHGHSAVVKLLLDNPKIDRNEADEIGMTPLHHAAKHGHSAVVKLLLDDPKIDRNEADKIRMTPLHHAVKNCRSAVVELLLADKKVKMDMGDLEGNTPLMLAVVHRARKTQSDEETPYFDITRMIVDKGPEIGIHAFNHQFHTPYYWALKTNQISVLVLFTEKMFSQTEGNPQHNQT